SRWGVRQPARDISRAERTAMSELMRADNSSDRTSSCHNGDGLSRKVMPASPANVMPACCSNALCTLLHAPYPLRRASDAPLAGVPALVANAEGGFRTYLRPGIVANPPPAGPPDKRRWI